MRLITKLRITAITTLVVLVYLAGKIREGEASYVFEDPNFVVTVQWLSENYYRVYLNDKDNPTNEDFFEAEYNTPSAPCPKLYYNENSKNTLYILDLSRKIKKINTPNYMVQYYTYIINRSDSTNIPALNNNLVVSKDGIMISEYESRYPITDNDSNIGWYFNEGDRNIKIIKQDKLSKKKYINPKLILFDRNDKTSR